MAAFKEEEMEEIDQKDDGYIELVLRVLARMCDGQHEGLQVSGHTQLDIHVSEDVCTRGRNQGQEQVITSHKYCGV